MGNHVAIHGNGAADTLADRHAAREASAASHPTQYDHPHPG
jgi:hypothetical protein